ncbi:HEAT repeat domain-containing protein [Candidatus Lokiarchaeum ossiferum]|uniref:HEAT repeat domain-containing protein n=1 Tax=Candidatus Lokiarchaeum ossiferum TaxID=2951803 RepID=UPI00352CEF92
MTEIAAADDLKRLRETTNIIEKLIIIQRFGYLDTSTVIYPILEAVSLGEQEVIAQATESLFKLKKYLLPSLKSEITNPNAFIRWTLTLVIKKMNEPRFLPILIPALGCGYRPVVEIILETLNQLNAERFPTKNLKSVFQNLLPDEKESVTHYAIRQLGILALDTTETLYALQNLHDLRFPNAIVPLFKVLHHSDYRVRDQARKILNSFSNEEKLKICLQTIKNKEFYNENYDFQLISGSNYPLHLYAIQGLGSIGNDTVNTRKILWSILRDGNKAEKIFALKALEQLQKSSKNKIQITTEIKNEITSFLNTLEGKNKLIAIKTLGRLGEEWATTTISSHLDDKDPKIRLSVINALTNSKHQNIVDKVAYLLIDKDRQIRRATVRLFEDLDRDYFQMQTSEGNVIDKLPEPIRTELLNKLLEKMQHESEDYQCFATFWLGTLGYKPAYDILIGNLKSSSEKLVLTTINALGMLGLAKAIRELIPFIYYIKNNQIRKKAIEVIGMLGEDKEGLHALIHQLFLQKEINPPYLEEHIISYGAGVIPLLNLEIENESSIQRKILLENYCSKVNGMYEVKNKQDFNILL